MSSRSEDLSCPVCCEIFTDPVVLSCSHSLCRACLQRWWREKKILECPVCKRRSSKSDPPRNLALKNLCEAFLEEKEQRASAAESKHLCRLHSEKLKLFCLDHLEPVCVVCRDSKTHTDHRFRPIDEAAQDHREELQKLLKPLQEKLKLHQQFKEDCDQTLKFIQTQTQETEQKIREQFKKLQVFLQQEEKNRVSALRTEEQLKTQRMKEKIKALSSDMAALSVTIRAAEKELRAEDTSFLQNYKTAVTRVQQHPVLGDPQPIPGALMDVVKHLGNLTYNIWNKMKQTVSYSPLLLDPNTADPELVVLDDLSGVRTGKRRQLPKNPERSRFSCSVLGSEGFSSGTHSWSVDVGKNQDWELGVLGQDLQAKSGVPALQSQLWRILFSEGRFTAFSTSQPEKCLKVTQTVKKIRVHLDFDRGKLSFSDQDTNTNIHTFTHTFTDTLFPYIYTENPLPVRVVPVNISVTLQTPGQEGSDRKD